LSRRVLNISREGESTASLGSLFQCSFTLRQAGVLESRLERLLEHEFACEKQTDKTSLDH